MKALATAQSAAMHNCVRSVLQASLTISFFVGRALAANPPVELVFTFSNSATTGANPAGNVVEVSPGVLVTTASACNGGPCGGTLIEIDTTIGLPGTATVLHSFTGGPDGAVPVGDLVFLGGKIYGVTQSGGITGGNCPNPCGTVYSIDPKDPTTYTIIHAFSGTDGSQPRGLIVGKDLLAA